MSLTLNSAIKELDQVFDNQWASIANAVSKGALRGARGNSGVILSQILKGMAQEFAKVQDGLTTKALAKAFVAGSDVAYKAVTKPREGTMLTVIRVMAETAERVCKKQSDLEQFFATVIDEGEKILQQTPEMLPVLKKAGVVDAGGRGLIVIFTGMYNVLMGIEDVEINVDNMNNQGTAGGDIIDFVMSEDNHVADIENLGEIEFGYCTEYMISHIKKKTTESDIDRLRERLMEIGDSVVCVGDLEFVKVHVHTNEPSKALGYAIELGELTNIKIDNMWEQSRELLQMRKAKRKPKKQFGMVAVAPGDGISAVFKDILVDSIIEGGQTMNPSADDIAKACEKVDAKHIFIFPNNKNIILAAEQAKDLVNGGRTVHVVQTKSVPEGVAAALAFNEEASVEENLSNMKAGIKAVKSGAVTYAVRETKVDKLSLNKGDIIGLDNKAILCKGSDINQTTIELVGKLATKDSFSATIFHGADVSNEVASELQVKLSEAYPSLDVTIIEGGQPVYYYIVSIE